MGELYYIVDKSTWSWLVVAYCCSYVPVIGLQSIECGIVSFLGFTFVNRISLCMLKFTSIWTSRISGRFQPYICIVETRMKCRLVNRCWFTFSFSLFVTDAVGMVNLYLLFPSVHLQRMPLFIFHTPFGHDFEFSSPLQRGANNFTSY